MIPILGKLVRYFFTAGIAAIVDIGGFILLNWAGASIAPAAALSFVVAAGINYLLTSRFVFSRRANARTFLLFFAAALVGLTVNVSVTILAFRELGLAAWLCKVMGVGAAFLVNFLLNVAIVFRRHDLRPCL